MSFVDPLWEFVLGDEDFNEDDTINNDGRGKEKSGKRRSFSRGRARKFESLDERDDNNATRRGSRKSAATRNRSVDSKSSTGSCGLKSKKNRSKSNSTEIIRKEYRKDKKDGFWDVITGAPPKATIPRRSTRRSTTKSTGSKGNNYREFPMTKTASELSKNSSKKGSETRFSFNSRSKPLATSSTGNSDKNKKGFKDRFRRSQSPKSRQRSSMEKSTSKPAVTTTALKSSPENTKPSKDDKFDPVDLLFTIADSLDPWAADASDVSFSEGESLDDTLDDTITAADTVTAADTITAAEEADGDNSIIDNKKGLESHHYAQLKSGSPSSKNDGKSSRKREDRFGGTFGSLLDQQPPDQKSIDRNRFPYHSGRSTKAESAVSTEIRLQVHPGDNIISEQVVNTHQNNNLGGVEHFVPLKSNFDDSSSSLYSNRSDDAIVQWSGSETRTREQSTLKENKGSIVVNRGKTSSNDTKIPKDVQIAQKLESEDYKMNDDSEHTKKCSLWKRTSCGSKKRNESDSLHRPREINAAEAFPTSRIIINGEIHSIIGPESNQMDVIGKSSTSLSQPGGGLPSVFAYEYESHENFDVSYKKPNRRPRDCISVRKLGGPPPLPLVGEDVVIQVEASTVSETDCIIRQGLWWRNCQPSFPNTPGIDMVGKVHSIKQKVAKAYDLKQMETVVSLVKWGGNARFMTIHPNQLVKVHANLDPAQVACLPEFYLSAFQVLHMGQVGSLRYTDNSLQGKSVLILGCMTNNMGKAMIELALHAGAANIYATSKKKHWKTLISSGVVPLSSDPMEYIHRVAGTIDLVLAPNGNLREDVSPVHFRALVPRYGQLIISGHRVNGHDIPIDDWKKNHRIPALACGKNKALQKILGNCVVYDVFDQWEKNLDLCKRDLSHLLQLLEKKKINPEVLDRISLKKVSKAHELIETKRLPGFLVCEPWMKDKKRAVYL